MRQILPKHELRFLFPKPRSKLPLAVGQDLLSVELFPELGLEVPSNSGCPRARTYRSEEVKCSRTANNLEHQFPDDPAMPIVNEIIVKRVVAVVPIIAAAIRRVVAGGRSADTGSLHPSNPALA